MMITKYRTSIQHPPESRKRFIGHATPAIILANGLWRVIGMEIRKMGK
jgi:hypothetical protein